MNAYSSLKIAHHQDRLNCIRSGQQPSPIQVQLIPTNMCNHSCSFCGYRMKDYTSNKTFHAGNYLSFPKIEEILDDCVAMGVKAVQVTGGGEPLMHKNCLEILQGILDRGLDLALVTNGTLLSPKYDEAVLQAKWVRFSLDAASAATYSEIRKVGSKTFYKTRENLRRLTYSDHHPDLVIGVGFVVTKDNWTEIAAAAELAKDEGASNIRISAVFQSEGAKYFEGFYKAILERCEIAREYADDTFQVYDNFSDRVADLEQESPDYSKCHFQELCTYVGADYGVYRCCTTAYNPLGLIGSLANQSFRQLWTSDAKRKDFREFDAQGCPRCMFNDKNQTVEYLVDDQPLHGNFI